MPDILSQEEISALLNSAEERTRPLVEKLLALPGAREVLEESGEFEKWKGQSENYVPSKNLLDKLKQLPGAEEALAEAEKGKVKSQADTDAEDGQELDPLAEEMLKMMEEEGEVEREPVAEKEVGEIKEQAEETVKSRTTSGGRIVTSYDFKLPARVNSDQLRTLENLHDNFARLLSSTFAAAMRAVVDVDIAFVDQTTYAEYIMSLSNPSCSYQFTLGPTNGQAIIDFDLPVVFAFVDRIFGGKGSSQGVDARILTPIEIGVINRIVKRVIEDLEATWEPVLRVEIADIELETNPEFMQITAASEIVILLAFEINSANASGQLSLCYPFFTLERVLPRLAQQSYVRTNRPNREELIRSNRAVLGPVQVPLVVEMGRAELPLADAENLQVGDVICAGSRSTDPCVVFVGEEPKFYARPFATENGGIKLQVVGKVPRELENNYRS